MVLPTLANTSPSRGKHPHKGPAFLALPEEDWARQIEMIRAEPRYKGATETHYMARTDSLRQGLEGVAPLGYVPECTLPTAFDYPDCILPTALAHAFDGCFNRATVVPGKLLDLT